MWEEKEGRREILFKCMKQMTRFFSRCSSHAVLLKKIHTSSLTIFKIQSSEPYANPSPESF